MRNSKNKTGLFNFIADRIAEMDTVDPVIVTKEDLVVSNHEIRLNDMSPCSHEEYVCTCQACGTERLQSPYD